MEKIKLEGKIKEEIEKLLKLSDGYLLKEVRMDEVEKGLLQQLLKIGLVILGCIVREKLKESRTYVPKNDTGQKMKSTGCRSRKYLSLFGHMEIERPSYWREGTGQFHKLDEILSLPVGQLWSYNIQSLVGKNSSETDYRESVCTINELLGLGLSGKSSERNATRLGAQVDEFYDRHSFLEEKEGLYFSAGFDGKGVPKIKPSLEIKDNPKQRLNRGEKRGIKQMATVSVTGSFTAETRTSESIIKGLMGKEKEKKGSEKTVVKVVEKTDNGLYKNIHRRGFLANQEKAIDYGIRDLKTRMTNKNSRFVVPIDAGIGLEAQVLACVSKYKLKSKFDGIIIDIVHVSEYVWDAVTAIFGEKSSLRRPKVAELLKDLLEGRMEEVIAYLNSNVEKTELSDSKKEQINKTITYFNNHKHKMNYKKFLDKGYPISSAIVESTCKHLVKDRMEQSGMRWSSSGAQHMMDLRAVKINGDMKEFMTFVTAENRKIELIKIAA
jgi:hypothetical protein